jgi:O-antigen/teichoic acid export membrane protein
MNKNIGSIDRSIRVILALIFAVLIVAKTVVGTLAIVLGILAVVFLLTAVIGFCPLYCPFKLSTLKKKE